MAGLLKTLEEKVLSSGLLHGLVLFPMFALPYADAQTEGSKPKIVFVSSREPHMQDYEVYSMNIDGSDKQNVSKRYEGSDWGPSYAQVGKGSSNKRKGFFNPDFMISP